MIISSPLWILQLDHCSCCSSAAHVPFVCHIPVQSSIIIHLDDLGPRLEKYPSSGLITFGDTTVVDQ
jgi:hypothetical protein